ncbi:pyrimidine/purine nucleoside phosphorylase [Pseudodesulfovibrio thermohalotolerans]|uniref:pyrimidine/purine nucleoside phosphorylase n=1 Tax=Pseudodesulfovibrio thermohalotolerans TaxID=2880651 RepID=UPI0022B9F396|nr:pyrimidine/purine nucleoside phosphorylase [Pseudodesulfovibrio thermohalotolerans]WFS63183.1 pyrimidine/purine nucleoside phosphorylase [Pseudodesulfovibrio thermohalotolerans]
MTAFANATINKKANVYYDGKVTSRTITLSDGSVKTLGIMLPGEYEFGTEKPEFMEITAGELSVQLPGFDEWVAMTAGQSFNVPGDAKFRVKVITVTDYCCSYMD